MFTGIISDIGSVRAIRTATADGDLRAELATSWDTGTIDAGASIACSGVCLTVVGKGAGWFVVELSGETLARTTLGAWEEGVRVNLERSLRAGDELGGHIVSGHVDGVVELTDQRPEGGSLRLEFAVPSDLAPFIAGKGSVTLDGVSLTVNGVGDRGFDVNIIPHTRNATTLGDRRPGDRLNLEIDVLARYVGRLLEKDRT